MSKGEARQAFPEASLSRTRPTREVAGTCRPVPGRPVNHPARRPRLCDAVARETPRPQP